MSKWMNDRVFLDFNRWQKFDGGGDVKALKISYNS